MNRADPVTVNKNTGLQINDLLFFRLYTGGCLYKGLNRAMATMTGAALALGVQWIASLSDKELEPFILSGSLFVFGACVIHLVRP
jgi:hypothetical protein